MILETERLLLRNFIYDDLDSLYNYRNDPNFENEGYLKELDSVIYSLHNLI